MASGTAASDHATGSETLRLWHPERSSRECGHLLHPCDAQTALCPKCTLWKSTEKFYQTQNILLLEGGPEPPPTERNRKWYLARLSHQIATRRYERAQKKYDARKVRQKEWDQAHEHLEDATSLSDRSPTPPPCCPVCSVSEANDSDSYHYTVKLTTAWWEKSNTSFTGLSFEDMNLDSSSAPEPRKERARIPMPRIRRPPSFMRDFIRLGYEEISGFDYRGPHPEGYQWRTDVAVRCKCAMIEIPAYTTDYLKPVCAAPLLWVYRNRRVEEREHRNGSYINKGALSRKKLGPSPLRAVENVDDFEVTEELLLEVAEVERAQREYRWARSQVGLLYLVGTEKTLMEELGGIVYWNDHESVRRRRNRPPLLSLPLVDDSMCGTHTDTGFLGDCADDDTGRADSVLLGVGQHFASELPGWGGGGGGGEYNREYPDSERVLGDSIGGDGVTGNGTFGGGSGGDGTHRDSFEGVSIVENSIGGGDNDGCSTADRRLSDTELFDQFITYETCGEEEGASIDPAPPTPVRSWDPGLNTNGGGFANSEPDMMEGVEFTCPGF